MSGPRIDFARVNAVALSSLESLLPRWLPGGKVNGGEYVCGSLDGGAGRSLSVNLTSGVWSDFSADGVGGSDPVSLYAALHNLKMGEAARRLAGELGIDVGGNGSAPRMKATSTPVDLLGKQTKDPWRAMLEVPAHAPPPPDTFRRKEGGQWVNLSLVGRWTYRSGEGAALFHVCRFEHPDGGKEIVPQTFCYTLDDKEAWRWKSYPEPRPLYGLDRLAAAKPDAPVLLVEGEKTADAAGRLLAGAVCMTWPGGSKAVKKADFKPLAGRRVAVWPDADKPGFEAALALSARMTEAGAVEVSIITPPDGVAEGWDLADGEAEGWTPEQVEEHIKAHKMDVAAFEVLARERYGIEAKAPEKAVSPPTESPGTSAHLEMARACITAFGAGNIVFTLGNFWRWDASGVWRKTEAQAVKQKAHVLYPDKIKSSHTVMSILELAKTEAFMDGQVFTPLEGRSINCRSGVLRWSGREWVLHPHRREDYATAQVPVAYAPDADAPRFEQFLTEIFRQDEDAEDKAILVCEALGYSLLTSSEFEKFFLLIGAGANGKSVLLNVMEAMAGRENACAVQPSQFDNRFQRAHLHGKLVNIVSEIAEGAEIADAQLKAIVSGELTTAEHKLKAPFDFRPYATCWFGTNHLPHTRDFSQALFRRAVVIQFNRVFAEHEQDKLLCQKLKAELPGIFNLALEALAGVFERGMFTMPESSMRACKEWRLQADQVAQFAEECCRFGPDLKCTSKEMFIRYGEWATDAGIVRKLNRKNFTDRMVRLGAAIHRGTGGNRSLLGVEVAA